MHVFINGAATPCESGCTLAQLLDRLHIAADQCATAVNGTFVARDQRGDTVLNNNDQVMTFEPITGG
jgi:sulfur carrier protein